MLDGLIALNVTDADPVLVDEQIVHHVDEGLDVDDRHVDHVGLHPDELPMIAHGGSWVDRHLQLDLLERITRRGQNLHIEDLVVETDRRDDELVHILGGEGDFLEAGLAPAHLVETDDPEDRIDPYRHVDVGLDDEFERRGLRIVGHDLDRLVLYARQFFAVEGDIHPGGFPGLDFGNLEVGYRAATAAFDSADDE